MIHTQHITMSPKHVAALCALIAAVAAAPTEVIRAARPADVSFEQWAATFGYSLTRPGEKKDSTSILRAQLSHALQLHIDWWVPCDDE